MSSDSIPRRPVVRSQLTAHGGRDQGVWLLADGEHHVLRGELYERLVPLLDGTSTSDEIVDRLGPSFAPERVYYALASLASKGLVRDHSTSLISANAPHWDALGLDPATCEHRLAETPIAMDSCGAPAGEEAAAILAAHGLAVERSPEIQIVLTDHYLDPALPEHAQAARDHGRRWLLCKPIGRTVWIGPLFEDGEAACFECLRARLIQTQPVHARLMRNGASSDPGTRRTSMSSAERLALTILANRLATAIVTEDFTPFHDVILSYDTLEHTTARHAVASRPQCSTCGPAMADPPGTGTPVKLSPTPKHPTTAGGYRSASPEDSLARLMRHVSPITGIVTEPKRLPVPEASFLWVYRIAPNKAPRLDGPDQLGRAPTTACIGKGATDVEARVSAIGEAVEFYSGTFHGDEPRVRGRMADLEEAIHPNACMHFSDEQYEHRAAINTSTGSLNRIPEPFDPDRVIDWTRLWSLTESRFKCLPTELSYFDTPCGKGAETCVPVTNGVAAGSSREDAVLHGVLELIERDCVAVWWYNRLRRPGVATEGRTGPLAEALSESYRRMGREWWALDLTHDLGVPCFAAVTRRVEGDPEDILMGFGAHLDARIALRRAMTEMHQVLAVRRSMRDPGALSPEFDRWLKGAALADHPYLAPSDAPATNVAEMTGPDHADLCDDLEWCHRRIKDQGLELLVLDQTRPEVGVPVVRCVVPGLRHVRPRFAPGRLYDVPVRTGWLGAATAQTDLNSVPMFV